jgi:hypothetical protein
VIDEKTLEEIVRTVVRRILEQHPELVSRSDDEDVVMNHQGRVLSEDDLNRCRKQGKRAIRIYKGTVITPLARDRCRDLGVDILVRDERRPR